MTKRTFRQLALYGLIPWHLMLGTASATTFFVDAVKGNDNAAGTAAAPFLTFQRSMKALHPGDTLNVNPGTFTQPMVISVSGTATAPITIQGNVATPPFITANVETIDFAANYINVTGFEAVNTGIGSAIRTRPGTHHITISSNIAHDSGCSGVLGVQSDYLTIQDNTIYNNSMRASDQCSAISLYQMTNVDSAPGYHNVITRNLVYNNTNVVPVAGETFTTDGNGIILDDFQHTQNGLTTPPYTALTLVSNNVVFHNGGRGIHAFFSNNIVIMNNTTYSNLNDPKLQDDMPGEISAVNASNILVQNNIMAPKLATSAGMVNLTTVNATWNNNVVSQGLLDFAFPAGTLKGVNNVLDQNPKFVLPSPDVRLANFHLQPGSVALTAGSVSQAPTTNYDMQPRATSGAISAGAY